MNPEDRIRMLIGLDGEPVPRPLGPEDYTMPQIIPGPYIPLVRAYDAGMEYIGDGEPMAPMVQPGEWEERITLQPPSKKQKIAAAHQARRRAMGH
jgi:hypothetical protein